MHDQDGARIRELIWNGQHEQALERAHERYRQDPERFLIEWATTLYSARLSSYDITDDFEELVRPLIDRVAHAAAARNVDQLDVISTHLKWWGELNQLPYILEAAEEAAVAGWELAQDELPGAHSGSLLATTASHLEFKLGGHRLLARQHLCYAEERAQGITDPNQRTRVFKRIAAVYGTWMPWRVDQILIWYLRARRVDAAPDARAKVRLFGKI